MDVDQCDQGDWYSGKERIVGVAQDVCWLVSSDRNDRLYALRHNSLRSHFNPFAHRHCDLKRSHYRSNKSAI
ncbi:hypothetical protein LPJGGPFB_01577 [Ensifer adhaerens]|nr:hypothetical protein [Ensifer adhaerens]